MKHHKEKSAKHKSKHTKEKHKDTSKERKKDSASADEKLKVKEAKAFLKQRLKQQSGDKPRVKLDNSLPPSGFKVVAISEDDYFNKNPEFSAWLSDVKGVQFNDLEADDARSRFGDFVKAWNQAAVPHRMYSGVDGGSLRRTQHSWGMRETEGGGAIVRGMAAALEEEREAAAAAAVGRQVERRKWKEEQTELLDQMLPPATAGTGDARVEARMARREDKRARDGSPDMAHLPGGGDAMGFGGDDSFTAAKQREATAAQKRQRFGGYKTAEAAQKLAEHGQKEDATMAQFRALLDRGPIAIAKR